MSELTGKRARFVAEYTVDCNATAAAKRAGYSEKTAYSQGERLLRNVEVAASIKARQDFLAEKVEVTAEMVLKGFIKIYDRCSAPETFDSAGANRALENLGKHLGLFIDRTETKGHVEVRYLTDSADKPPDAGM